MDQETRFIIVFATVWIVCGLASTIIFFLSRNIELKRRILVANVVLAALLLPLFAWTVDMPANGAILLSIWMPIVMAFSIRVNRVCRSCGKLVQIHPIRRPAICPNCSANPDVWVD